MVACIMKRITIHIPLGVSQAQPEVQTLEWFFHRGEVALPSSARIEWVSTVIGESQWCGVRGYMCSWLLH